jgi:hypothetical protein
LTGSTEERYHAPVPVTVLRPSLHELADILEQIFYIAYTENLHPRPEEYDAATCDYAAEHGLSYSAMGLAMRQYGTLTEIHERAQVIALMRLYANRWRPWDPEGPRVRHPSRQPKPAPKRQQRKRSYA